MAIVPALFVYANGFEKPGSVPHGCKSHALVEGETTLYKETLFVWDGHTMKDGARLFHEKAKPVIYTGSTVASTDYPTYSYSSDFGFGSSKTISVGQFVKPTPITNATYTFSTSPISIAEVQSAKLKLYETAAKHYAMTSLSWSESWTDELKAEPDELLTTVKLYPAWQAEPLPEPVDTLASWIAEPEEFEGERALQVACVRRAHPEMTDEDVRAEVVERMR